MGKVASQVGWDGDAQSDKWRREQGRLPGGMGVAGGTVGCWLAMQGGWIKFCVLKAGFSGSRLGRLRIPNPAPVSPTGPSPNKAGMATGWRVGVPAAAAGVLI